MKTHRITTAGIMILFFFSLFALQAKGETPSQISGRVVAQQSGQGVPFATVAIFDSEGSSLLGGSTCDMEGSFDIAGPGEGQYILRISAVGFESLLQEISLNGKALNLGNILLSEEQISLQGVVVSGQRLRASASADGNTWYVNQLMQQASHTGLDILRLIPGIHLDMHRRLSLEGSQNILILVDGRERDSQYLSQLNARRIDRVEVISNPSSQYDASVSGVINIILKEREKGIEGGLFSELPLSAAEAYFFPNYNLNYGIGKFNFFTSYNGQISNFDIVESYRRSYLNSNDLQQLDARQYVRQKYWSHRFHYGVDFYINDKNQLNFYGFVNPHSNEHDGKSYLWLNGSDNWSWMAEKDDEDSNLMSLNSLYFKHLFNKEKNHELIAELSYQNMKGETSTRYTSPSGNFTNSMHPVYSAVIGKLNYNMPLGSSFRLRTGGQAQKHDMQDALHSSFSRQNLILAAHGSLGYQKNKLNFSAGMRYQSARSKSDGAPGTEHHAWLPALSAAWRFSAASNLSFSWRQAVSFPGYFQLNPNSGFEDPFTLTKGNPLLQESFRSHMTLEYSHRWGNHFVASRLFYNKISDVINKLAIIRPDGIMESSSQNLGDLSQLGLQLTAAFSFGGKSGLQPYVKVFDAISRPNELARQHQIGMRRQLAWESGFSVFAALPAEITASLQFQYASPLNDIQSNYYYGAQYFLSLERPLGRGLKAGIMSAMPFARQYTYQGSEISNPGFYNHSQGVIQMSTLPFWLHFSWQFSSGQKRQRIQHERELLDTRREKGFR